MTVILTGRPVINRKLIFLFILSIILLSSAHAMTGAMMRGNAQGSINDSCLELHSNWLPSYGSLTGYWKLNGKIGAITNGDTVVKEVGTAGVASNVNATGLSYVSGRLDQAAKFDGIDDYIKLDTSATAQKTVYTVALWVKPGTATTVRPLFVHADSNYCFYNPSISLTSSTGALTVQESGCGGTGVISNTTISTTAWSHIVLTRDGAIAKLYINGVLIVTDSSQPSITNAGGRTVIGAGYSGASGGSFSTFSDAIIDEVATWSTALSDADILSIYQHQVCN